MSIHSESEGGLSRKLATMEPAPTEHLTGDLNKDAEMLLQRGMSLGYGYWLRPFIDDNNVDPTDPDSEEAQAGSAEQRQGESTPESAQPERRRRGRPRVSATRNDSAIEVCLLSLMKRIVANAFTYRNVVLRCEKLSAPIKSEKTTPLSLSIKDATIFYRSYQTSLLKLRNYLGWLRK